MFEILRKGRLFPFARHHLRIQIMAASNPFSKRDWNALLGQEADDTNTFSKEEVLDLKSHCAVADNRLDLSAKAAEMISNVVRTENKKLIAIGESSHGTAEFYETRADITKRLIEDKRCYAILLEADMPPCAQLHRFVMGAEMTIKEAMQPFTHRFPSWMWGNEEMRSFVLWLREYNMAQTEIERVAIVGMDLYSLQTSIKEVLNYLCDHDPILAARVETEYSCFGGDTMLEPQTYGMLVEKGLHRSCATAATSACLAIVENLPTLAPPHTGLKEMDEAFINEMNARVVQGAEQYYRSMFAPNTISWNVRDRHFMDQVERTFEHLTRSRGQDYDRVCIWAHNSHVGNAHATHLEKKQAFLTNQKRYQSGGGGGEVDHEFNIGQLAKEIFPESSLLVGQFTYSGTVACADEWDGPQRVKTVRPGLFNSMEDVLHTVSGPGSNLLINLTDSETKNLTSLKTHRLQRAIGVIYRPDTERWSHYYTCDMSNQFDVVLWHDVTTAVCPLVL